MTDPSFKALRSLVKEQHKRLDKEVYAAWRAGYDFLHTTERINNDFELRCIFYPSNYHTPPFDTINTRTYDLREESLSDSAWKRLQDYKP